MQNVKTLQDSDLFKQLKQLAEKGRCPADLPGNVIAICEESADRLKLFPAIHGQFTLHDEIHCLRIVEIMRLIADVNIDQLNAFEIALLILAAYLHDQGMIVEHEEVTKIKASTEWTIHESNWMLNHPNFSESLSTQANPSLTEKERQSAAEQCGELYAAMFTDYIRKTHGKRSASYIQEKYGDDARLIWNSVPVAKTLAAICISHVRDAALITPANGYRFDELIGTAKVNVAKVAYILRLADILDFDRERTPDSLYRAIHFTSPVSVLEWEKHRSILGWVVSPTQIRYSAECTHPVYERSIHNFLDWIDEELVAVNRWNRSLPSDFSTASINVPQKVDRSEVRASVDPVNLQPIYQYHELEFSLSRDEIVKLLMTDGLYTNRSLFIRELLQNSLDALRYRSALHTTGGSELDGLSVRFEHTQESGYDILRCIDDGVGMDEQIVTSFLTRVGRSYYRSPEFDRERVRFRVRGCDFDPCARFGIGFMSCFMFGDDITIYTRRDCGMGQEYGKPLIVEIRGMGGMIVVRPGDSDQSVGTTVEVRGRQKSFTVDAWSDPVNLLEVLEGYALATEFPIIGHCGVQEIQGDIEILPDNSARPHPLEEVVTESKRLFLISPSAGDERLNGEIRIGMLTDSQGIPITENDDASIKMKESGTSKTRIVAQKDGTEIGLGYFSNTTQVCCDGILVAGNPGRQAGERLSRLGSYACNYGLGSSSFLLDVRGSLKPNITAARTPPKRNFGSDATWDRLFDAAGIAYSHLLDQIVPECNRSNDPERFWMVASAYQLDLYHLHLLTIWNDIKIPVSTGQDEIEWRAVPEIKCVKLKLPTGEDKRMELTVNDGGVVRMPESVLEFSKGEESGCINAYFFVRLFLSISKINTISSTEIELSLEKPQAIGRLAGTILRKKFDWDTHGHFADSFCSTICITGPDSVMNVEHPAVKKWLEFRHKPDADRSPLEHLLGRIARGNVGPEFDSSVDKKSWGARNRKQMALLFAAIDWEKVPRDLHPPYSVFRPGHGEDVLTTKHLEQWYSGG